MARFYALLLALTTSCVRPPSVGRSGFYTGLTVTTNMAALCAVASHGGFSSAFVRNRVTTLVIRAAADQLSQRVPAPDL